MRREVALEDGAELLRRDYDAFADDFDSFWPDVEVFARTRSGFVVAN
jgi:acyl carrier protein phosphodiesterase